VNKECESTSFVTLGMRSETKCPQKWRTNSLFLLLDNAPAHQSVLVKDFLAKINVTVLENPPYLSDLAPADFYLFSGLKSAMKEQCFCDATDITKNATVQLKRLSQNGFQECFQHLYSCIRGLLGKKRSLKDCTVLYFSEIK